MVTCTSCNNPCIMNEWHQHILICRGYGLATPYERLCNDCQRSYRNNEPFAHCNIILFQEQHAAELLNPAPEPVNQEPVNAEPILPEPAFLLAIDPEPEIPTDN